MDVASTERNTDVGVERRLAAILAADVVGYSRLMGRDEAGTHARLKRVRQEIAEPAVARHKGTIVKLMGDGALVELPSVVEAVACAIDIQREMAARNTDVPAGERIEFRIGINLGDVIVEPGDIYGEGVNVAARLEQLAEPGGICVSDLVFRSVEGKLDAIFEDMGEQQLKNIERPIRVHRVRSGVAKPGRALAHPRRRSRLGAIVVALALVLAGASGWLWWPRPAPAPSVDELVLKQPTALPLPDKPSLAVLPLANFSGDPAQDYFGDGLTENLITTLSRLPKLFVIARNSVFTYKGRAVNVQEVGKELGVRWVLEGSVQKAGDRVRIHAQLIDTTTGFHLWAERFDRKLEDLFALQDEVTTDILKALQIQLSGQERRSLARHYTTSIDAYDLYLRGQAAFWSGSQEGRVEARRLYEAAIDLDPRFALAYATLAMSLTGQAIEAPEAPQAALAEAARLAQKALSLNNSLPQVQVQLAFVNSYSDRPAEAQAAAERAITLDPNYADGYAVLATVLNHNGRPTDALDAMAKAMRLNPRGSSAYIQAIANSYFTLERYNSAIAALERLLAANPGYERARILLAASYAKSGRLEEARWQVDELLIQRPDIDIGDIRWAFPRGNPREFEALNDGLRLAGFPMGD